MRVGATVLLHSLAARPELNGQRGIVVKGADAKTGRFGVKLEGASAAIALKRANLVDVAAEVMATVFADMDLLRVIFRSVERWSRAGILSGVSATWKRCVWSDAELFRSIVVLGTLKPEPPPPAGAIARGMHRAKLYGARYFMEEGALPMQARHLRAKLSEPIAGRENAAACVEHLYIEPCENRNPNGLSNENESDPFIHVLFHALLPLTFPSLKTLLLQNVDDFCDASHLGEVEQETQRRPDGREGRVTIELKKSRARACRDFVQRHLPTLRHLHLNMEDTVELTEDGRVECTEPIFDLRTQPGLETMHLADTFNYSTGTRNHIQVDVVRSWPDAHRQRLRALDLKDYPPLSTVIELTRLLPNLRRIGWSWGGPEKEEVDQLAHALATSSLEALYLSIDSIDVATDLFDELACVPTLRELVVSCDSCDLHRAAKHESEIRSAKPSYSELTARLCRTLAEGPCGGAAVLVCDINSLRYALDPTHRVYLPSTEEEWHLEPGAHGLEHLPFLSQHEIKILRSRVHTMTELWSGRRERPDPEDVRPTPFSGSTLGPQLAELMAQMGAQVVHQ